MILTSERQIGVRSHLGTRFLKFPGVGVHKSSHNKRLGLDAGVRKAALHEKLIQTNFGDSGQLILRDFTLTLCPRWLVEVVDNLLSPSAVRAVATMSARFRPASVYCVSGLSWSKNKSGSVIARTLGLCQRRQNWRGTA